MAEYAFGLLLIISRKINRAFHDIKKGDVRTADYLGFDLKACAQALKTFKALPHRLSFCCEKSGVCFEISERVSPRIRHCPNNGERHIPQRGDLSNRRAFHIDTNGIARFFQFVFLFVLLRTKLT